VANPDKFAAALLAEDKSWTKDKIDKLMANGKNTAIDLDRPIPVHTTYFTAVVDADGKVKTFGDIYRLDAKVASAVIGKSVGAPAVAQTTPSGSLATTSP
jgi:murein L,D-transpeptidase YcbB/YkuD